MAEKDDKKMTVEEAGRKGGEATSESHGKDFYQEIGKKGGEATADSHDKDFYEDIGSKGGKARWGEDENGNKKDNK